jgi:hypothetical protein
LSNFWQRRSEAFPKRPIIAVTYCPSITHVSKITLELKQQQNLNRKQKARTFWCIAGTMARRRTRQTSPSAGISPVPITNSSISARMPCTQHDQTLRYSFLKTKFFHTVGEWLQPIQIGEPYLGVSLGVVSQNVLGHGRIRDDKERLKEGKEVQSISGNMVVGFFRGRGWFNGGASPWARS